VCGGFDAERHFLVVRLGAHFFFPVRFDLIAPSFPTRKKVCRSENFQQAKAAEAEAEAEAKKAEAEAAPMRLMNQKKEEEDKEKEGQQKKGAQNNKDEYIETDVNNDDSDNEVLATQDKVDNTDRPPVGKRRCVKKQSPVVADSDVRDRKKARVVAVSVSKKTFFQKSQKALETKVLELSTRLESFEKTVEARFKETNALISKVLTKMTRADPFPALADTVRSERENSIARTEHKTTTVRSEQKNNTVRTKRKAARGSIDQIQKSNNKATKLSPIKEKVSMGLTFRFCETLDDFLDGYNARLLMSSEQLSKFNSGGEVYALLVSLLLEAVRDGLSRRDFRLRDIVWRESRRLHRRVRSCNGRSTLFGRPF